MAAHLRVILEEHDIRKLTLPTGIPNTVEDLLLIIVETFQLDGEFGLLYEDNDFGNQFFSVTSTADLHDKATVKLFRKELVITLDLHPIDKFGLSSTLSSGDSVSNRELDIFPAVDNMSSLASSI